MQCLNTSNKEVAALLKEYTEILGSENAAYYVLSENDGLPLDRTPVWGSSNGTTINESVERVSNYLFNKLSIKSRPYRPRKESNDRKDSRYIVDRIIGLYYDLTGLNLEIEGENTIQNVLDNINFELHNNFKDKVLKKYSEIPKNADFLSEGIYRNSLQQFLRKGSDDISGYTPKTQAIIKEVFPKLFGQNNFKSKKQAFAFYTRMFNTPSSFVYRKFKSLVDANNKNYFVEKAISRKYETIIDLLDLIPDAPYRIEAKILSESKRLIEYSNYVDKKHQAEEVNGKLKQAIDKFKFQGIEDVEANARMLEYFPTLRPYTENNENYVIGESNTEYVLKKIIDNNNGFYSEYAKRILEFVDNQNYNVKLVSTVKRVGSGIAGRFYMDDKGKSSAVIEVNASSNLYKKNPEQVLLHEITHSLTSLYLMNNPEVEKTIEGYIEYLKEYVKDNDRFSFFPTTIYGFKDSHEFIAEFFSNPDFQELLKQIPPASKDANKLKNLFESILNTILKIFNIPTNAFEEIKPLMEKIIEVQHDMDLLEGENISLLQFNLEENYKLAPNGKPSKLFNDLLEYYNGDYDKAVKAKSQIYTDSFKNWFGDWQSEDKTNVSKVVDENGEPLVVYHGGSSGINTFYNAKDNPNYENTKHQGYSISDRVGIYFSKYLDVAKGYKRPYGKNGEIYPVFLSIKNPKNVSFTETLKNRLIRFGTLGLVKRSTVDEISENELETLYNSYDGVNHSNGTEFIVFHSNQIKSIYNQGTFSTQDNNIYNQEGSTTGNGRNQQLATLLQNLYPDIEVDALMDSNLRGQAQVEGNMAGRVLLNAMLENQDTLPHEYAHHYIAWFRNAPIVQRGIKQFGSEEALVQAIGENSLDAIKWYKRLLNVIKRLFSKKQRVLNELTNDFLHGTNLGTVTFSGTETHFQTANAGIPKRIQKIYDRIMEGLDRRIADVEFSKFKGNRENELRRLQYQLNQAENDKATLDFVDYMADDILNQFNELRNMRTAYNNYKANGTPHNITQEQLDIIRKGFVGFYSNLVTNIQDMLDDPTTFNYFNDKDLVESARNTLHVTLGQFNEAVRLFNGLVDDIAKDDLISEASKHGQWTVNDLNRILDDGDFDINWWDRYIGQSQYVNNPMIQLLLNKMIAQKNKVYDETLIKGKEILDALSKVDKSKLKYLWEKDEKGRKTGYLASSLNRGKHRQDFIKFKQELAEELGYSNEDLEGLEDKLTDEQYKIWSQKINEWDAKHTERRFLPEYYEITNTLSLEAKRRRDDINNEIKILLLPTVDEDGNFHRELLSDEDYVKLENLERQRRNLANKFYEDGTEKLGIDAEVAKEFQNYNERLRKRLNYKPNMEKFAKAYRKAQKELTPELFKKWLQRNTVVRITEAFYDEIKQLSANLPKTDLQVELEEARRQLLKLYMDSEGKVDVNAMPSNVKQMIVDYDEMIKQEVFSNMIPGVKSQIYKIATWEVNPEYQKQYDRMQAIGGAEFQDWLAYNTVDGEPASFWKKLVPRPEFRKYYMERIPNRSWSEIDKESPLYNPNFDESYGEARIPKKSLYENKDYAKIENDPQLKHLYDLLYQTMNESVSKINFLRYADPYRLPQIEGNAWTQIAGSDNVLKGLGHSIMSGLSVRPEDEVYANMTKALRSDGSAVKLIPTRYIKMLDDPNLITEDIVGSVIHFYKMASNYQRMSEIAPEMETILDFAGRMEIKKKGSGELLDTKASRFYNKLNSLVNDLVYGEESNPMNFSIFGKEISFDKIARGLANYTRKVGIAQNLNVIITGLVTNKVQNRLTAIEGIYFNNAELWAAASILKKSYYNAISNIGNPNNKNKTLCFLEYVGVVRDVDKTFKDLQRNRISRALNQNFWYFGHSMSDYVTKGKTVIAVALHSKYDPTENKFITRNEFMRKYSNKRQGEAAWKALDTTLYDAFEVKNNQLVIKDEYKDVLDEVTLNRFRNTCKQIGTKIDTQLTDLDRSWVQQNAFGRLIFIYRNWLITWWQNKIATKPQFNIISGMYQDAQFHAAYKAIQTYFNPKKLQQLKELYKENFDEVSEYNKAALRKVTMEFITSYIIMFIISAIFSAIASDDKDDFYKNEIALIAARAGVELRSNVLPFEGLSLFQNPSAAWGTLQYFWDMINIMWNDPTEEVRSGPYKGMKRYQRSLIKATPLRSIFEAQDPRSKLQYYENFILFNQ